MPGRRVAQLQPQLDELRERATALANDWAAAAALQRTAGQERALLRILGVGGLDAAGRPLAAEVVDRFLKAGPDRLGGGIILPFAIALLEYDLVPQALALDIASGAVDLALEGELLDVPERRATAEAEARRLVGSGMERIDANRVARRELIDVLGEPPRPWLGTSLVQPVAQDAAAEARAVIRDGCDLLRVEVPSGRELTARLHALGVTIRGWEPGDRPGGSADERLELQPTGSQRGLAALRSAVDACAAERPAYVRLQTTTPALSAPEAAVVAALERIDLVESDPIDEIVTVGVDPERALADHGFARRVLRRAGASIVIGAGPLVVAPDLTRGQPSDPGARAGRALALQLLGGTLALAQGMPAEHVFIGAMPAWLLGERRPFARAAAEISVRRALLPECPLVFAEPADGLQSGAWPCLVGALLPAAPAGALVVRSPVDGEFGQLAAATRAAAAVAAELSEAIGAGRLQGEALDHARQTISVAVETLEQIDARGWTAVVGQGMSAALDGAGWIGRGPASVSPRQAAFDPLADVLSDRVPEAR
jgi:beta-lysine 5,6-aminomutase alpha subunit